MVGGIVGSDLLAAVAFMVAVVPSVVFVIRRTLSPVPMQTPVVGAAAAAAGVAELLLEQDFIALLASPVLFTVLVLLGLAQER